MSRISRSVIAREVVVAKKGVQGFIKTRIIDATTTICDNRIEIVSSLFGAICSITGLGGMEPMPVSFKCCAEHKGSLINTRDTHIILKFAETVSWHNDEEHGIVFQGIILDNSNHRWSVKCSADGQIKVLRPLGALKQDYLDTKTKTRKKNNVGRVIQHPGIRRFETEIIYEELRKAGSY